jgi:hypothetical protein
MREYTRRLVTGAVLLAGGALVWYVGRRLLDLTDALIDRVGPIWAMIVVGVVTVGLGAVWIRYGGAGALSRWGVTIRPALPSHPAAGEPDEGLTGHVPGSPGHASSEER